MSYLFVESPQQFTSLLDRMRESSWVALDTEFISEGRYESQLCLVQIAYDAGLALIDPLKIPNMASFWELLCDAGREVVVHAGRSEMEFCFRAIRRFPEWLFDVQLAAGFLGIDYPAGFRSLVDKLLGVGLTKTETLSNWLKRPLNEQQVEYALNDVRYLASLSSLMKRELKKVNRFAWFHDESIQSSFKLRRDLESQKWQNTPKVSSLSSREQAIVRELWFWRDQLAKKTNLIPNRVLRDDLLIEIAKLKSSDTDRIGTIRGLNRPDIVRQYDEIKAAVDRALRLLPSELPQAASRQSYPQYSVMTQFMYAAFNMLCKEQNVATSLVGTQTDVREFIAHLYGMLPDGIVPRITNGWRANVVGDTLRKLFDGHIAMRLNKTDPEIPIKFID